MKKLMFLLLFMPLFLQAQNNFDLQAPGHLSIDNYSKIVGKTADSIVINKVILEFLLKQWPKDSIVVINDLKRKVDSLEIVLQLTKVELDLYKYYFQKKHCSSLK